MIKTIQLEDASEERPSNSQIKRLTVGDHIQLIHNKERFTTVLAFIRKDDMVGIVMQVDRVGELPPGLHHEDLVTFETKHIHRILPDEKRMKLPPFLLVTHPDQKDPFVLHTKYPRLIASIKFGSKVSAVDAVWLDEPVNYDAEAPALLDKIADWYFYSFMNKKSVNGY